MDARNQFLTAVVSMAAGLLLADGLQANGGAKPGNLRTRNFVVTAPDQQLASQIGFAAEKFRRELALEWLGRELPDWPKPCVITAQINRQAFGETSFSFAGQRGKPSQPFDFVMQVNGSRERILDSVLPHEVSHTIFATHFGQPLPRWADEGACTTVEHLSERRKNHHMLIEFLTTGRGIPFNKMFAMKKYPRDILPLYAQGYSLCRFLIQRGGKRKFIQFMGEGLKNSNWKMAVGQHYQIDDLSDLQVQWLQWVKSGCPKPSTELLVKANTRLNNDSSRLVTPNAKTSSSDAPVQRPVEAVPTSVDSSPEQPSATQAKQVGGSAGNFYLREIERSRSESVMR